VRPGTFNAIAFCYPFFVQVESLVYAPLVYPPYDAPLIEAYGGLFESVCVILHPFVSVPDHLAWKATKQYPSDEQIASLGAKCTWASVGAQTGLSTLAKLNQALLTSIRSLKDEFCDFTAGDALNRFLESDSIWMPGEGRFEPLLQDDFLAAFETAGHEELIFVPEFPTIDPVQHIDIRKLAAREVSFPSRGSLVAPDASFLLTVDWDSFFTLFYGPHDFLTQVASRRQLEGFFATPTTEHRWFNYSLGCSIVTISPEVWTTG
jgi:Protein of unknown function (DUF2711)